MSRARWSRTPGRCRTARSGGCSFSRRSRTPTELGSCSTTRSAAGFALLGLHVDPAAGLSAKAAGWWRSIGARSVQVLAPRGAPGPDPGGRRKRPDRPADDWSAIVEDVDGAFRDWLLRRPADNVIVVRPDRYVAAICSLGDLERVTGKLRRILG